jgi:hypothetical protein
MPFRVIAVPITMGPVDRVRHGKSSVFHSDLEFELLDEKQFR